MERQAKADDRQKLTRLTQRILIEWDTAAAAERRKLAEAEARKRLGMEAA